MVRIWDIINSIHVMFIFTGFQLVNVVLFMIIYLHFSRNMVLCNKWCRYSI